MSLTANDDTTSESALPPHRVEYEIPVVDLIPLTEHQISKVQEAFDLCDLEKTGRIPANEVGCVLRSLGVNPTKMEIVDMLMEQEQGQQGQLGQQGQQTREKQGKDQQELLLLLDPTVDIWSCEENKLCRPTATVNMETFLKMAQRAFSKEIIDDSEQEEIIVAFGIVDPNDTGRVSIDQFRTIMNLIGPVLSPYVARGRTTEEMIELGLQMASSKVDNDDSNSSSNSNADHDNDSHATIDYKAFTKQLCPSSMRPLDTM